MYTQFRLATKLNYAGPSCYELGLNRPASASSNSLVKGLLSRLPPFGLQISIIFGIQLLFILVTRRSQFDLYLLGFSSTGSAFKLFQNFFIPFVIKKGVLRCSSKKFPLD